METKTKIEFDDEISAIHESVKRRLMQLKDTGKFALCNRRITPFFDYYRDSLYCYDGNVILFERLFKIDKCSTDKVSVPIYTKENQQMIDEFINFSDNLPNASELSKEEQKSITDKLNEYEHKISKCKPRNKNIPILKYNNAVLTKLSDYDEESIDVLISIFTDYMCSYLRFIAFNSISNFNIEVRGVELDDYVDIIIVLDKRTE